MSYNRADLLVRLVKVAFGHVRVEDDLSHDGAYSPGARDHAQEARNHLLELLYNVPGPSTYDALVELSSFHERQYLKDRMLTLAERRAGLDLESSEWQPNDLETFAAQAEQPPASQKELFELAVSRLDDLKLELKATKAKRASCGLSKLNTL